MSKSQSLHHILTHARGREKEYDWLGAVESYHKAQTSVLKQKDFLKAGEMQEKIGFCLQNAAMQGKSQKEFREQMQKAIKAYEKARGFYEQSMKKQGATQKLRCEAVTRYLRHWLTSDPAEKRKLLDECLAFEGEALTRPTLSKDPLEYGKTYNELPLVFFNRVFLERDRQILKSVLERGVEWGENAITGLSEVGDVYELARAHLIVATCLSDAGFYFLAESEDIDGIRSEAVRHLMKAVELSEKIGDVLLSGLSHLWIGINSGEEEAAEHHEKALECGIKTMHNFLIANSLDYLAYNTYWKARATEDPEKRGELAEKAMAFYERAYYHYRIISFISPRGGLIGPPSGQAEHYHQLALWEHTSDKRRELLTKSERLGIKALKVAEDSDMPMVVAQVLHVISKTLQAQALMETDLQQKKSMLERALLHREKTIEIMDTLTPFFYWNLGVMRNYLAGIKAELANLEPDLERKRMLLEEATLSKRECLKFCKKVMPYFEKKGETGLYAALQTYQDTYVTLQTRLHEITGKPKHLIEAIKVLHEAIESASQLNLVSLIAESYWKIAKAQSTLLEYLEAAKNFKLASRSYLKAAERIPQLEDFYRDHATYMQAWNEIEKARHYHARKQYRYAEEYYEKAAELHKSTVRWNYLSSNYFAWARLEAAEDLSRTEQSQEAVQLFQKAANLFHEAESTLKEAVERIENDDERDQAERLLKALSVRGEYCLGRIALEEAKILSRQGDNATSSRKYGLAASLFQGILDSIEQEPCFSKETKAKDRQELLPIIYLCKAWQMMTRAEAEASPELYQEACHLFDEARKYSFNEKAKLLALGHSHFCKALNAGTKFEDSREKKLYLSATRHLESAGNYYLRAGFKIASEYATATQRLFDAYIYMTNAKKEADPEKKARYYIVAEKVLQASIGSYLKAKHPAKSKQVRQLLEEVREERKLAISLSEILHAPTITSSTASFVTPTPSEETAVGLERFEHANIQARLIQPKQEISAGEDVYMGIQITNVGKQTVLLDKVEEILPPSFEVVTKPSYYDFEDTHLNMDGKKLDPLKTEEITLSIRSFEDGVFVVKPRILYFGENGHQMVSEIEQGAIKVSKVSLPDRITTGYERLDNLLLGGIPAENAIVLTSPSCDERDLLIRWFLETGVKEGQTTFYVTTKTIGIEILTGEFQPHLYLFICNAQAAKMVTNTSHVVKLKGVENLTEINIALTSTLRKLSTPDRTPRRCCIQILSDVLLQHKALQTRRWLSGFLPELKARGFTILAVMDPMMHSSQEARAVLDLFDGEISIYEKEEDKDIHRFLQIQRMTNQEYLESELRLSGGMA